MQQGSILPFLQKLKSSRPENDRPGQPYHRRPSSESGKHESNNHNSSGQSSRPNHHRRPNNRRDMHLKKIADETKEELPKILGAILGLDASESAIVDLADLGALSAGECPGFTMPSNDAYAGTKGTRIQVLDMDTFDATLHLDPTYKVHTHLGLPDPGTVLNTLNNDNDKNDRRTTTPPSHPPTRPVAVLNLASERSPGGGWQNGALAQEECLCYRSSLYLSLHRSYYPIPSLSAIYTPSVVLIRDAMSRGHSLLTPAIAPADLPVVSVISVAALRKPLLTDDRKHFKNEGQRAETKRKIRLTLRVAAHKGHTKLVLGALGCGVFANPPKEVAECFLEVLREKEFQGGWWEEVAFAVLDNVKGDDGGKDGKGNFGCFHRVLDGQIV
jgi:hypothetical protein